MNTRLPKNRNPLTLLGGKLAYRMDHLGVLLQRLCEAAAVVKEALDAIAPTLVSCMDDVMSADQAARAFVGQKVGADAAQANEATTPASPVSG